MKDHRPLFYRAEAPRLGSVHGLVVKHRIISPSMIADGRQSNKIVRSRPNEEDVKAEGRSLAKVKKFTDATLGVSCALRLETKSAFQLLKVAKN